MSKNMLRIRKTTEGRLHNRRTDGYDKPLNGPWQQSWNGKRWEDMPGTGSDIKKLNFFLFRRGMLEIHAEPARYLINR